jgi:hypothetical protein
MANTELAEIKQMMFQPDGSNFIEEVERIENLLINSNSSDIFVSSNRTNVLFSSLIKFSLIILVKLDIIIIFLL